MTIPQRTPAWLLPLLLAATTTAAAAPAQAEPLSFQEQRALMRQMTQRLQDRLEQRLRCIDKATKLADLQACQRSTGGGWPRGAGMGAGMGGAGMGDPAMGGPAWCCPMMW